MYVLLFGISALSVSSQLWCNDAVAKFNETFNGISLFYTSPHHGLTSSVIRGLTRLGITYNTNPKRGDIKDVYFCLQDHMLLRNGLKLKEAGTVKKLVVGPNMFARAYEENHLLAHPAIDHYLVPSEWTRIACTQDEEPVARIIKVWPAGVDTSYWQPTEHKGHKHDVVVYWKSGSQDFCDKVQHILRKYGWNPTVIKYGNYTHEQYKKLLDHARFAVFISQSESQGLALAECWSMNVPTLVWDPEQLYYLGKHYDPVTACPYLTPDTGRRWKELRELESLVKTIHLYLSQFSPRRWVLDNMSDEVSAALLLKIINE